MEEQKQAEQQWNKIRRERINILKEAPSEENLWQAVMAFQDYPFKTVTGLPFQYTLKTGKNGEWTKELWIDRREKSKSLSWSSVVLAFKNSRKTTEIVKRPKALGDIRGISYIYPILWRLGLIRVPEKFEEKMACGIGACLACVCQSKEKDAHSNVKNKRICKEGPVFRAEEVEF